MFLVSDTTADAATVSSGMIRRLPGLAALCVAAASRRAHAPTVPSAAVPLLLLLRLGASRAHIDGALAPAARRMLRGMQPEEARMPTPPRGVGAGRRASIHGLAGAARCVGQMRRQIRQGGQEAPGGQRAAAAAHVVMRTGACAPPRRARVYAAPVWDADGLSRVLADGGMPWCCACARAVTHELLVRARTKNVSYAQQSALVTRALAAEVVTAVATVSRTCPSVRRPDNPIKTRDARDSRRFLATEWSAVDAKAILDAVRDETAPRMTVA